MLCRPNRRAPTKCAAPAGAYADWQDASCMADEDRAISAALETNRDRPGLHRECRPGWRADGDIERPARRGDGDVELARPRGRNHPGRRRLPGPPGARCHRRPRREMPVHRDRVSAAPGHQVIDPQPVGSQPPAAPVLTCRVDAVLPVRITTCWRRTPDWNVSNEKEIA